jgi:hypothetical protein
MRGDEGSQKALTEINTLLEAILQETAE